MLPDVTPAVLRALQMAQQGAGSRENHAVEPRHLLAALLEEEEGQAVVLLQRAGCNVSAFRQAIAEPPAGPLEDPGLTPLPLGPCVRQALLRARELAAEQSVDRVVTSEHLLVALVQTDAELAAIVESFGSDLAQLAAAARADHGPPLRLDEPLDLAEPAEQIDTARILDASANRAREALRVIEDYARFSLDDAYLSGELKRLRHDLTEALGGLSQSLLLEARETLHDVGTSLSTPAEQRRQSLPAVARANLKRLQEALRSLEEYSKLSSGELGQTLEKLRYRSYTLERALLLGADARRRLADARLYVLIGGSLCSAALDWTIQEAAAGGAYVFQLREKELDDRALLARARLVRQWTRQAGVLFIVNDRPDLARLADADGVHLGQGDLPVKDARRIVGPDALIGVSTHNLDQVRQAILDGASYIGVGPTFPSGTKPFTDFPGLEFVRQATAETSLPAFVLGGVRADNISTAVAAGARRVAVSQAICQADDPRRAAAELRRRLDTHA